jgi:hypothetical protein
LKTRKQELVLHATKDALLVRPPNNALSAKRDLFSSIITVLRLALMVTHLLLRSANHVNRKTVINAIASQTNAMNAAKATFSQRNVFPNVPKELSSKTKNVRNVIKDAMNAKTNQSAINVRLNSSFMMELALINVQMEKLKLMEDVSLVLIKTARAA